MTEESLDWDRLPDEPAKFFGLPPRFDRRALKQRYHFWLQRFKPEKFPEEFRKIRAAYESLDEWLKRFGEDPGSRPQPVVPAPAEIPLPPAEPTSLRPTEESTGSRLPAHSDSTVSEPTVPRPLPRPARPRLVSLHQRIQEVPPAELLAQLQEQAWSGADELVRIFLEDVNAGGDEARFLEQLLGAQQRFPRDPRLLDVLREFLDSPEAAAACDRLLPVLFRHASPLQIFLQSPPLWKALAALGDTEAISRLIPQCLAVTVGAARQQRADFERFLMRTFLFQADAGWIASQLAQCGTIEVDVEYTPAEETEIRVLEFLLRYRQQRPTFRNGDPLRERCDEVLRAWCLGADDFEERWLTCCSDIAADWAGCERAFGPRSGLSQTNSADTEAVRNFVAVWSLLSLLQSQKAGTEPDDWLDDQHQAKCLQLVRRLCENLHYRRWQEQNRNLQRFLWWNETWLGQRGFLRWKTPAQLQAWDQRQLQSLVQLYFRDLRPRLTAFLEQFPVSRGLLRQHFEHVGGTEFDRLRLIAVLNSDLALEIFLLCRRIEA